MGPLGAMEAGPHAEQPAQIRGCPPSDAAANARAEPRRHAQHTTGPAGQHNVEHEGDLLSRGFSLAVVFVCSTRVDLRCGKA